MALTKEQVRHVAQLARLDLRPEEEERYARQLGAVLDYVEQLQKVDVTGVAPLAHPLPLPAAEREDVVLPSLSRDEALANAPQKVGEGVAVPRIIE